MPKEIDWNRYKLVKVEEKEDKNISPFIGRLEFHIEEINIIPDYNLYKGKQIISK